MGTPRNIYRHVIMSDLDQVTATLPRVSDSLDSEMRLCMYVCVTLYWEIFVEEEEYSLDFARRN